MVRAILNAYQDEALDSLLELDIMHRVGDTQGKPMDIMCRVWINRYQYFMNDTNI